MASAVDLANAVVGRPPVRINITTSSDGGAQQQQFSPLESGVDVDAGDSIAQPETDQLLLHHSSLLSVGASNDLIRILSDIINPTAGAKDDRDRVREVNDSQYQSFPQAGVMVVSRGT
jgi:hypothetical protein